MRHASTLDFSRVSAVASAVASAISACRPRRRLSVVVGERRSPVLDSLRERALDSSLGGRGRRDESVVTGVHLVSPVLAMRYASPLDFSRVSAVASAVSACRPRRRLSVVVGERRRPVLESRRERALDPLWVGEGGVMRAS